MNVFEYAMQMELDGRAYYEKMAGQADNASIKSILLELAQDEVKHYTIFKKFSQGDFSGAEEMKASGTRVLQNAKNVFQQIAKDKKDYSFAADTRETWKKAQEIEKKSEDFYREKAAAENDDKIKATLNLIADEEHKHWALIEHVIQFLDRPEQWLEDAEWNHLDEY